MQTYSRGRFASKRSDNRHNRDKPFFYYVCRSAVREKKCNALTIRCDDLDKAVLDAKWNAGTDRAKALICPEMASWEEAV